MSCRQSWKWAVAIAAMPLLGWLYSPPRWWMTPPKWYYARAYTDWPMSWMIHIEGLTAEEIRCGVPGTETASEWE